MQVLQALFIGGLAITVSIPPQADAQETQDTQVESALRSACLRSGKVNLHVGPGLNYPVDWVLTLKHMPVLILSDFGAWRRIKLYDGTVGWVHKSLLCGKKTAMTKRSVLLMSGASDTSRPLAKMGKLVVVYVVKRSGEWIKVLVNTPEQDKLVGWVPEKELWGIL